MISHSLKKWFAIELSPLATDIIMMGVLALAGARFTMGIERGVDLLLYDESLYLLAGVRLAAQGLNCPECGPLFAPLYNLWYYLLSFLTPDRIDLYWLNYKLVTILPALATYLFLRRNDVSLVISLITAVIVLTSPANLPVWPKPSHFALIVLLIFLILASRAATPQRTIFYGAVGALLMSYARPEYFLVFGLLTLIFLWLVFRARERRTRGDLVTVGVLAAIVGACVLAVGLPVSNYRSFYAFGQHFSLHWAVWTVTPYQPWADWQIHVAQNFGPVNSVMGALMANPSMFFRHVLENAAGLLVTPRLFLSPLFFDDRLAKAAAAAVILVFILARGRFIGNMRRYSVVLLVVGLFIAASLASILVVYSREHYFTIPVLLTIGMIALFAASDPSSKPKYSVLYLTFAGLIVLALTPAPYADIKPVPRENQETMGYLRALEITRPVFLLESEGGYDIYLPSNYHRIVEYDKSTGFREFVRSRKVNMMVVSEYLRNDVRFVQDPEWRDFLSAPEAWGFHQIQIPNTHRTLYIHKDLEKGS